MTVNDIIARLKNIDGDKIVTIGDGKGWCDIDRIIETQCEVTLIEEHTPVFSDN